MLAGFWKIVDCTHAHAIALHPLRPAPKRRVLPLAPCRWWTSFEIASTLLPYLARPCCDTAHTHTHCNDLRIVTHRASNTPLAARRCCIHPLRTLGHYTSSCHPSATPAASQSVRQHSVRQHSVQHTHTHALLQSRPLHRPLCASQSLVICDLPALASSSRLLHILVLRNGVKSMHAPPPAACRSHWHSAPCDRATLAPKPRYPLTVTIAVPPGIQACCSWRWWCRKELFDHPAHPEPFRRRI